jgi:MoxR-like ATPase
MANTITLLTNEERAKLPLVISRRSKFRQIVRLSIQNYNRTSSNCIMISGRPGTGKTTLVEQLLEQMTEEEQIGAYKRVPGHVTMKSLFGLLKDVHDPLRNTRGEIVPQVLVLDDTDCLTEEAPLELMKAAFDSRTNLPTNRKVYYYTEADGKTGFKFNGFGIIITNTDFTNKKHTVHQDALLDRVQQLSVDLEPQDMMIYTTYLIEDMLNKNEDHYSNEELEAVTSLFNNEIRKWMEKDAFRKAHVNFSTRLIKNFADCMRLFGDDFKNYSIPYQRLEAACMIEDTIDSLGNDEEAPNYQARKNVARPKVRVIKKPKQNAQGLYINEATGLPYSAARQYTLKKQFA